MNWITLLGLIAAFCTTISFLPQAIKTIKTQDTSSISLSMYIFFTVGTFLWLLFGLFSNNIPIIIANFITLILASIILIFKIKHTSNRS
ncbi:SemiSWEET transporter [Ferruginibacter albus]|uniref:SemiSWEET transporter n=1 Tax=Ferruginibacter albus TaxID=2875540 RepID=UPI001CC64616|nr:SemiSWEET transporter [Ferruginibacter albus]UAY52141.1 SemiSWEET transporter [Ferruginibacter albus]